MNEQTEWLRALAQLSPFLLPLVSAIVVLLIRDLLDPRQWQRYVRKIVASIFFGLTVFAVIVAAYVFLLQSTGNQDSPLIVFVSVVVGLAIIPVTIFAVVVGFNRVEPDMDRFMNSRFAYCFRNGQWPTLSMAVRSECLPEGTTFIVGRIP